MIMCKWFVDRLRHLKVIDDDKPDIYKGITIEPSNEIDCKIEFHINVIEYHECKNRKPVLKKNRKKSNGTPLIARNKR